MGIAARGLQMRALVLSMSAQPRHVAESLLVSDLLRAIAEVASGRRHLGPEVADLAFEGLEGYAKDDPLAVLTPRQRQIVLLVVRGCTSAEIGDQLYLSPKTVDTYRSRLMGKLRVSGFSNAVARGAPLAAAGLPWLTLVSTVERHRSASRCAHCKWGRHEAVLFLRAARIPAFPQRGKEIGRAHV